MKALLIAALLAAGVAHADLVAKAGKNELRLTQAPCVNPAVLDNLRPEFHSQFKAGHAEVNGKGFEACWIDTGQGVYFVLFDDGDTHAFPITIFSESSV